MKIKKDKLKEIIKEEINNYLDEVIDGQFELEEEVPEPSDEDHLFNLLTKEFDRIPQEKRRSVYTRFLSAANKYADKVSVNQAPVPTDVNLAESLILEELNEVLIDENLLAKVGNFLLKKMGIAKDKAQEALGFIKQIMQAKKKYNLEMDSLRKFAQSQGAGLSLRENLYEILPKPVATAIAKANLGLMNLLGSKATIRILKALKIGVPVMMALAILTDAGDAITGAAEAFDAMTQDPEIGSNAEQIANIVKSASGAAGDAAGAAGDAAGAAGDAAGAAGDVAGAAGDVAAKAGAGAAKAGAGAAKAGAGAGGDAAALASGIPSDLMATDGFMKKLAKVYKEMELYEKHGDSVEPYEEGFRKFLGEEGFKIYDKYMSMRKSGGFSGKKMQQDILNMFNEGGQELSPEQIIKTLNTMPNKEKYFGSSGIRVLARMLTGKLM